MSAVTEIPTPSGHVVIVDTDDIARISGRVSIGSHGYAQIWAGEPPQVVLLHRWLMGVQRGEGYSRIVDHINGDKLDNRRANLRIVDGTTSNLNRGVRGRCVYPTIHGTWVAKVTHRGNTHNLGCYATEYEALQVVADFRRDHGIIHERFEAA